MYGEPAALEVAGPLRGYVGDTLTYVAEIVDVDGNPTIGVLTWAVQDTTRARIVTEGEGFVQVVLLRPGRLTLVANVERFDRLAIGGTYGPGSGDLEGDFQWAAAGPFQLPCVYGGADWPPPDPHPCANQAVAFMCAVGYAGEWPVYASNRACAEAAGIATVPGDLDWPQLDRAMLATVYTNQIKLVPLWAFQNYGPLGVPSSVQAG